MKKILFAVFAHPDDEALGPSGALYKRARQGSELYLVCVTDGSAGERVPGQDIRKVRQKEWKAAGALLGARRMDALGYRDGTLSNSLYHEIAGKIERLVRQACEQEPAEISFMTFEPNGLTGHLDHIAVSYITTFVFYNLRQASPPGSAVKELAYFCLSNEQAPLPDLDYFVFMPAGRDPSYINRQVHTRDCLAKKREIIGVHQSQTKDVAAALACSDELLSVESFHVIT